MIKNILLLFNVLVLLLINIVFVDLKIIPDSPSEVSAGEEFTFKLTVNKGDVRGFAKIQQMLPEGFTASEIETKGASFTFSDGKVKFIWMSLPADESFTISYKVKVAENVSGKFNIDGKFSYLENNERKTFEFPTQSITVGSTEAEQVAEETPASNTETQGNATGTQQGEGSCTRIITDEGNGLYNVELQIAMGKLTGFAKAQDVVPAGATATKSNTNNAVFSFVGQKAKFVWMSIPPEEKINISYKLFLGTASLNDLDDITGEFSYLENNETKKVKFVTVSGEMLADKPAEEKNTDGLIVQQSAKQANAEEEANPTEESTEARDETVSDEQAQVNEEEQQEDAEAQAKADEEEKKKQEAEAQAKADEEEKKRQEAEAQAKADEEEKKKQEAEAQAKADERARKEEEAKRQREADAQASNSSTQNGVAYRVQIAAGHVNLKDIAGAFKSEFEYSGAVPDIYPHEGWLKYLISTHNQYRSARDNRNEVTNDYPKLPGPFVTAYNDGQRITVQEALMISNQKWVD